MYVYNIFAKRCKYYKIEYKKICIAYKSRLIETRHTFELQELSPTVTAMAPESSA